jgi:mannose-1-phosphate guanylyltransferase
VGEGVHLYDCKWTVVHISDLKGAVIAGLEGYIVAEKGGRLLICPLSEEQRIRDFEK